MNYIEGKPRSGISRVLSAAGGYGLLAFALLGNLAEGYSRARIASDGGKMLDAVISRSPGEMRSYFFMILAFIGLLALGIFVKDSLLGQYLEKGMLRLRKKTIESLGDAQMSWLDGHHTGKLSARVMADLNALSNALRPVLIMGISIALFQIVCIVFMFLSNWLLTLVVFAIVPLTTFIQWLSSHPIRRYRRANQDAVGQLSSVVFDCFGSFETIKSLSLEEEMKKRFGRAQEKQVDAAVRETGVVAAMTLISGLGRHLPQLILLIVGGTFVINRMMTLGQLTMFISLSSGVIRTMGNMGTLLSNIRQLGVNAERIVELWDSPREQDLFAQDSASGAAPDTSGPGALTFNGVSFAYGSADKTAGAQGPGEQVLNNVSFTVKQGDFAALVGESGCGKSTVMKLAVSLYNPSMGSIGVLGRDMAGWDLLSLRSRIAYVTQDTYLFPGTLRDNISAGSSEVSESLMEECIEAAQLSSFVESLPAGLDTEVGERGVFLSGGQRQRISIARALYKRAELLFLDEATSALDRSTEEAVLKGIRNMAGSKPTLIAITHSLNNVRDADCIFGFKSGKLLESGSHETLLAHNGEYARLLAGQKDDLAF